MGYLLKYVQLYIIQYVSIQYIYIINIYIYIYIRTTAARLCASVLQGESRKTNDICKDTTLCSQQKLTQQKGYMYITISQPPKKDL